jgi:gluconate 5-dehydrogenase
MSMEDLFLLKGRVAVVTGAAQGLGAAMAESLAKAGARVVLIDRNADGLEKRRSAFERNGYLTDAVAFDVTDSNAAETAIREIAERRGRLDILVNNAGILVIKRIENHTVADWERVIETNLTSLYVLARASAVHMAAGGYGRIINVASVMGIVARSGIISYVAAKHGVIGLTKALAAEFAMKNINSNAIAPGYFLTEINKSVQDDKAFYELVKSRTPLHRWGSPEELAGPVQFLASPASSFVNGHILVVDGGMCATNLEPPFLP